MKGHVACLLLLISFQHLVYGAPAPDKDVDKRREATPEVMELEQQLKMQAGEDKKFFPNQQNEPLPQIDGLEDHPVLPPDDDLSPQEQLDQLNPDGENDMPDITDDEEEEDDDEGEREAFLVGLIQSLQRHPEVLDALMQGDGSEESDDVEDEEARYLADSLYPENNDAARADEEEALREEVMSALGWRGKYSLPSDQDQGRQNMGRQEEQNEQELASLDEDREQDSIHENSEDEQQSQENAPEDYDYYQMLLKLQALKNQQPNPLGENLQLYRGDPNAHVVAKKQGYWPADSYQRLPPEATSDSDEEGSGDMDESHKGAIPMLSDNDLDNLDVLGDNWESYKGRPRRQERAAYSRQLYHM